MRDVWKVQMEMLDYLLKVCNKHNLNIWADGGTLLGTIRHKGYIPWDDDIDLMMFREDYDKLLSLAKTEFTSPYILQSAYTDIRYYRGHAQVRCDNTAAIRPDDIFCDFHQGIFIDIFVYDYVPSFEDKDYWQKKMKKADLIQRRLLSYMNNVVVSLHPLYLCSYLYDKVYFKIISPLRHFKNFENIFRSYNKDNCNHISCPAFLRRDFDKTTKKVVWYQSTIWMPFEGMKIPVPNGYDQILRTQYGDDYMVPKQIPSYHGNVIFSTTQSYKELLPMLRYEYKKIRKNAWIKKILDKLYGR